MWYLFMENRISFPILSTRVNCNKAGLIKKKKTKQSPRKSNSVTKVRSTGKEEQQIIK